MIVGEGPDGGGKTSLIRRLNQDLGLPIAPKVVSSQMTPLTDLRQWTEDNVSRGFQKTLFDRHRIISEPIYGPATRAKQDLAFLDMGWMMEMTARFYGADPILIYCLPPLHVVRDNVNREDTDNGAVKNRIGAIYAGYVSRATLDIVHGKARLYNYQTTPYEDMLRWVQRELEKREESYDHHPRAAVQQRPRRAGAHA